MLKRNRNPLDFNHKLKLVNLKCCGNHKNLLNFIFLFILLNICYIFVLDLKLMYYSKKKKKSSNFGIFLSIIKS